MLQRGMIMAITNPQARRTGAMIEEKSTKTPQSLYTLLRLHYIRENNNRTFVNTRMKQRSTERDS